MSHISVFDWIALQIWIAYLLYPPEPAQSRPSRAFSLGKRGGAADPEGEPGHFKDWNGRENRRRETVRDKKTIFVKILFLFLLYCVIVETI